MAGDTESAPATSSELSSPTASAEPRARSPGGTKGNAVKKSSNGLTKPANRVSVVERTTASALSQYRVSPASGSKQAETPLGNPVTPVARKSISKSSRETTPSSTPAHMARTPAAVTPSPTLSGKSPSPTNQLRLSTSSYASSKPHESVMNRTTASVMSHRYDKDRAEIEHLKSEDIWWEQRGARAGQTYKKNADPGAGKESPSAPKPLTAIEPLNPTSHLLKPTHAAEASKYHHQEGIKVVDPKSIPPLPASSHLTSATAASARWHYDAPPVPPTDTFKPSFKKTPIYEQLHSKLLEPTVATSNSVYKKKVNESEGEMSPDRDAFGVKYVFSADKTLDSEHPTPPKSAGKSTAFKDVPSKLMAPTVASMHATWKSKQEDEAVATAPARGGSIGSLPSDGNSLSDERRRSSSAEIMRDGVPDIQMSSSSSPRSPRRKSSIYDNVPSKLMAPTASYEHGKASPVHLDAAPAFKPGGMQKMGSADSNDKDVKKPKTPPQYANVKSRLHEQTKATKYKEWGFTPEQKPVELHYHNKGKYEDVPSRLRNPTRASISGAWSPKHLEQEPELAAYTTSNNNNTTTSAGTTTAASGANTDGSGDVSSNETASSVVAKDEINPNPFLVKLREISGSPDLGRASTGGNASNNAESLPPASVPIDAAPADPVTSTSSPANAEPSAAPIPSSPVSPPTSPNGASRGSLKSLFGSIKKS